jgi:hypothetical protein
MCLVWGVAWCVLLLGVSFWVVRVRCGGFGVVGGVVVGSSGGCLFRVFDVLFRVLLLAFGESFFVVEGGWVGCVVVAIRDVFWCVFMFEDVVFFPGFGLVFCFYCFF